MCKSLSKWHFDVENDKLVDLVLEGKKTAYVDIYNGEKEELNSESILNYDNEKSACITKTIKTIICKFKDIEWNLAKLEGISNSLEEWKERRYNYFKSVNSNFNDNTLVLVKVFEVTKNLREERLSLGKLIAENNIEILGNIKTINEINAGFNNTIFDVNDKYIIKVCGNKDYENLFDVENDFYSEYKTKSFIPKLYKYDKSKIIVPFVYEIIEKIDGKSIYYYWYKWNEIERENFIKDLVECLNSIHVHKSVNDEWKNKIKNEVINNFNKCSEFFSEEEKIIKKKPCEWNEEFADIVYDNVEKHKYFITNLGKCTQVDARVIPNSVYEKYLNLLLKEIEIIKPKIIITFGNQVSSILLNKNISVSQCRKQYYILNISNSIYKVYPVYYPIGNGMMNIDKAIEDLKYIIDNNVKHV